METRTAALARRNEEARENPIEIDHSDEGRNTRETRSSALARQNEEARENPIEIDISDDDM